MLRRVLLQRAVGGCDTARGDAAARLGVAGEIRRGRPLARNRGAGFAPGKQSGTAKHSVSSLRNQRGSGFSFTAFQK